MREPCGSAQIHPFMTASGGGWSRETEEEHGEEPTTGATAAGDSPRKWNCPAFGICFTRGGSHFPRESPIGDGGGVKDGGKHSGKAKKWCSCGWWQRVAQCSASVRPWRVSLGVGPLLDSRRGGVSATAACAPTPHVEP